MPVDDIKKKKPPQSQVKPEEIPGYFTPSGMAGSPAQPPPQPRQFTPSQVIRGEIPISPTAQQQPQQESIAGVDYDFTPPLPPTMRWQSRFFTADQLKDDDGQLEIGYWLTELEQTAMRVVYVLGFYIPGGAIVLARIQEAGGVP